MHFDAYRHMDQKIQAIDAEACIVSTVAGILIVDRSRHEALSRPSPLLW
jgi:hypothetical protein